MSPEDRDAAWKQAGQATFGIGSVPEPAIQRLWRRRGRCALVRGQQAEERGEVWQARQEYLDAAGCYGLGKLTAETHEAYLRAGRMEETHLRSLAATKHPATVSAHAYSAGWCYYHAGAYAEARRLVEEFLPQPWIDPHARQRLEELRDALEGKSHVSDEGIRTSD